MRIAVRAALQKCDFVAVSDCVARTDTTALAHVLLPAAAWGEKDGTVTNSERRISRQRAFQPLPGEVRADWWIMAQVAQRMGFTQEFDYTTPAQIFDEHARLSTLENGGTRGFDIGGLAGLTAQEYENLEPVQWPIPRRGHRGTQRLFEDGRFQHSDGKARFIPTAPSEPGSRADEEFPFILNTGRIRDQWHTMTRTSRSPRLNEHLPEPFVDLHALDALSVAVKEGELARVTTPRGVDGHARSHERRDDAWQRVCPIHWSAENASQGRAGALVSAIVDPISGEPEFKHTPAGVEPFPVEWYGFILSRTPLSITDVTWWTVVRGKGFLRYELAGREVPRDWAGWMRHRLGALGCKLRLSRLSRCRGRQLSRRAPGERASCSVSFHLTPARSAREGVAGGFVRAQELSATERAGLLAGRPPGAREDVGPMVCSCFAVGRNTLRRTIAQHALTDTRQVGARLRAGTNCGSCLPEIRALLAENAQGRRFTFQHPYPLRRRRVDQYSAI